MKNFVGRKNNVVAREGKSIMNTEKKTEWIQQENKPLISIIIPVYNVERYLVQCIDSVCGQTYKNLEIILINDGSTDQSGNICDEYAKKDLRIKVIHKENGGNTSARKAGFTVATGEYIGFVDSDDWIDETMFGDLMEAMQKYQADFYPLQSQIEVAHQGS